MTASLPPHDFELGLVASDIDGTLLAEAFHHPAGRDATPREIGLSAALVEDRDGVVLRVATAVVAYWG